MDVLLELAVILLLVLLNGVFAMSELALSSPRAGCGCSACSAQGGRAPPSR
ncbi:hypothetical protein ACFFMP_03700 [Pseudoroseomonas cervicalis]|uniref:hypothetical protein n=1 Tax=Teichococcus cervicalis TaxID=204525 RepID=UPI0035E77B12